MPSTKSSLSPNSLKFNQSPIKRRKSVREPTAGFISFQFPRNLQEHLYNVYLFFWWKKKKKKWLKFEFLWEWPIYRRFYDGSSVCGSSRWIPHCSMLVHFHTQLFRRSRLSIMLLLILSPFPLQLRIHSSVLCSSHSGAHSFSRHSLVINHSPHFPPPTLAPSLSLFLFSFLRAFFISFFIFRFSGYILGSALLYHLRFIQPPREQSGHERRSTVWRGGWEAAWPRARADPQSEAICVPQDPKHIHICAITKTTLGVIRVTWENADSSETKIENKVIK